MYPHQLPLDIMAFSSLVLLLHALVCVLVFVCACVCVCTKYINLSCLVYRALLVCIWVQD